MNKENCEKDKLIWAGQDGYVPKLNTKDNEGEETVDKPSSLNPADLITFWRTGVICSLPHLKKEIENLSANVSEEVYAELAEDFNKLISKQQELVTEKSNRELKDLILTLSAKLSAVKEELKENK